ncbi:hypothetical protein HKB47_03465 [Mesorhizobium japonicum]|nr:MULTISPECIES: hypothetical protein [Mesorhizobium]MBE1707466.1 hypothetical protein [Mesorhizobium japonicum]MBE1712590.1 hypothetical protein [Mesorhizobium japonicum]MUT24598.1 hypothetical protein [Mesorhizobium japonicum]MUT29420.1 hypothetical protein [Mesorhizobium japonicum]QJF00047.1 hypothetical protein R7A2020_03465 [Mesorhizobium japonicum R7A]
MKKRHAEWLNLTAGNLPAPSCPAFRMRILDLPGFEAIERKLLLYTSVRSELSPALALEVDDLSAKTFGIVRNDTLFSWPSHYDDLHQASPERWRIDDEFYEHEEKYETGEATDDEAVAILAGLGLDFNDNRGLPLRCTKLFCRQAEAAAKRIIGALPDQATVNLEAWGNALAQAAQLHINKKRSG